MMEHTEIFDAARIELRRGINLVEASAGTGKTYAIAMLVLRLVAEEAIPVEQILVVTFTRAATAELRERIRKRLVEARDVLLGKSGAAADRVLLDWAGAVADRQACLPRLQQAVSEIDRAAILTIHGFCQRMLQEQALESRQLFAVELVPDPQAARAQVANDYWRRLLYGDETLLGTVIASLFAGPEQLLQTVARVGGDIAGIEPEPAAPEHLQFRLDDLHRRLCQWWRQDSDRLRRHFAEAIADGMCNKPLSGVFEQWWQQLDDFFAGRRKQLPGNIGWLGRAGLVQVLNGRRLRDDVKKAAYLAGWPLADDLADQWLDAVAEVRLAVRAGLAEALRSEVPRRMRRQGMMSYDDLILGLKEAVEGEDGGRLRGILAERFNAALIDEFQDTDAHQWRIFSALFGGGRHFLYLIGDPKQAIYRFRGADIHAYFAARSRADRLLTLDRNFRSHPGLVAAVNRLFEGDNPFLFAEASLPCPPVRAARTESDGALVVDGVPVAPMLYCQLPGPSGGKSSRWGSGEASGRIREYVVAEISRLLSGKAELVSDQEGARQLAARDIAILVRSNSQARTFQEALTAAGIPAVEASRTSVFDTEECEDILRLLQAIQQPGNQGRLKAAMTSRCFGLSGQQLEAIWQDETAADAWRLRFQGYSRRWEEQGLLAMMNALLHEEHVFTHLAGDERGERRIANIFHLLEIIQEHAESERLGPARLLQWLQSMRGKKDDRREEFELRLESDDEAVQVVTMHRAKGLEYPLVFCPFLWYRSGRTGGEENMVTFHDAENRLLADLGSAEFQERRRQAEREELSEDLRLLYVAVTRARLRCWVFWADVRGHGDDVVDSFASALGHLLFPRESLDERGTVDEQGQLERVQQMAEGAGAAWQITVQDASPVSCDGDGDGEPLTCRQPGLRPLGTVWQMSSYSALAGQSIREEGRAAEGWGDGAAGGAGDPQPIEVPGLPAGARFGNVVHDILEQIPFTELANGSGSTERLDPFIRRHGLAVDAGKLAVLLGHAVGARLQPDGSGGQPFSLAELVPGRMIREMPFYMHLERATTTAINGILAPDPAVAPLSFREMQGYLTGFVDLVCEHDGRFHVIDYKTNNLGDCRGDYLPERLTGAMRQHNYGLQYWIYSLVLHRYLRSFLPGYQFRRHFGGVSYLFVRGMSTDRPGAGVYSVSPDALRLQALDALLGAKA
jgi:exodeoxyribonuclease V beta subunit